MSTGIMIIGPSGSGKTTLGRFVAAQLGYPYFDVDDYIWRKDTKEPYTVCLLYTSFCDVIIFRFLSTIKRRICVTGERRLEKVSEYLFLWALGGTIYYEFEMIFRGFSHWSMFVLGGICLCFIAWQGKMVHWRDALWRQTVRCVIFEMCIRDSVSTSLC